MTNKSAIRRIVIVGGGSAGWMTAAMLSKLLNQHVDITLVESSDIGTVGVGEATIPPIQYFNNVLGLKEHEFLKATQGTYKLGIQFENWGKQGESYMHAFGPIGQSVGLTPFHHYWLRANASGHTSSLWDYSYNYQAAKQHKFAKQRNLPGTNLPGPVFAYHFDASAYARLLGQKSQAAGVKRKEGTIDRVMTCPESGNITGLQLQDGSRVDGDFFIDCSGFRGLLIGQTLNNEYEEWSHWLPCDRAIAVQSKHDGHIPPYTRSIAHRAGWQWRIPLQHRNGNGIVYSSQYMTDEDAETELLSTLDGEVLTTPNRLKFTTGQRKQHWVKNCLAIGLSSGFLEPLESTSLHLVQQSITRFIKLFPSSNNWQREADEFNRQATTEMERIRDFIILHYHLNQRDDSPFWQHLRDMTIPDSLRHKIELYRSSGRFFREDEELFTEVAWIQVFTGQNLIPDAWHSMADMIPAEHLQQYLRQFANAISQAVPALDSHEAVLKKLS